MAFSPADSYLEDLYSDVKQENGKNPEKDFI